jgi:hypothetical protein
MLCGFFDVCCSFGGQIRAIIISRNYLSRSVWAAFYGREKVPPQDNGEDFERWTDGDT